MSLRFVFSFLIFSFVLLLLHVVLFTHLVLPFFAFDNEFLNVFFAIALGFSLTGFLIVRIIPFTFRMILEPALYIWLGISYLFFISIILVFPLKVFTSLIFDLNNESLTVITLCLGGLLASAAFLQVRKGLYVQKVKLPLNPEVHSEVEDLKIVVLSDIHVSTLRRTKEMEKLVAAVNPLKPDLIFITGDLVDGSVKDLKDYLTPFHHLSASYGIYFVTGNHEYYSGVKEWKDFLTHALKWNVLSNSVATVSHKGANITILGIEDRTSAPSKQVGTVHDPRLLSLKKAYENDFAKNPTSKPTLTFLLAHQPKDTTLLPLMPCEVDLQISGHTHGGQIWPFEWLVKKDQKYVKGLYDLSPHMLYVNQGTGYWGPPMRLGTFCEITLLTFSRKV
jgi:predicted MPP superfamily phosphohydrolase